MKNNPNKINSSDNSKKEKLYSNIISEETKINTLEANKEKIKNKLNSFNRKRDEGNI